MRYFNSIKVQLEPPIKTETRESTLFQFHKGTIRTIVLFHSLIILVYFNSIKVQLELIFPSDEIKTQLNFNSIKVQLELTTLFLYSVSVIFQFHKGTIRTR